VWKKWFNNAAMNRLEDRLGRENDRHENKRYDLRRLEPKIVDTMEIRDNYSKYYWRFGYPVGYPHYS
jgi:hypothetical protein